MGPIRGGRGSHRFLGLIRRVVDKRAVDCESSVQDEHDLVEGG